MCVYGYARVSSKDRCEDSQVDALKKFGAIKIFNKKASTRSRGDFFFQNCRKLFGNSNLTVMGADKSKIRFKKLGFGALSVTEKSFLSP